MTYLKHATILCALFWAASPLAGARWILVDTSDRTLSVLDEDRVLESFNDIAIGRNGAAPSRVINDGTTPIGEFVISRINPESRFHLFFGINFPSEDNVKRAYMDGKITLDTFLDLWEFRHRHGYFPQNSKLGGNIGIHGLGAASENIHRSGDWTDGCVALTNEQINHLRRYLKIGTKVVIR